MEIVNRIGIAIPMVIAGAVLASAGVSVYDWQLYVVMVLIAFAYGIGMASDDK